MLKRVNKIYYLLLILIISSCNHEQKKLQEKIKLYHSFSEKIITKQVYDDGYKKANDSINLWIKENLPNYLNQRVNTWQLDSLICFNATANKIVMALLTQTTYYPAAQHDNIDFFYGVKINSIWYYFQGANVMIPRSIYQNDPHTPLSFEKLHEIAMQEVFNGYLIKDDKGVWQVNDRFFDDITSKAYCSTCKTEEEFEKVWLGNVAANWANRDTTNYKK